MLKNIIYIISSIFLSIGLAFYQRITGPTYSVRGKINFLSNDISYSLPRSCSVSIDDCKAYIKNTDVNFYILYKRYSVKEDFKRVDALKDTSKVYVLIPDDFPPATRIEYDAYIEKDGNVFKLNKDRIVLRFKNRVNSGVLILHIVMMFLSLMVMSYIILRIMLDGTYSVVVFWLGYILLFLGGFIFGPLLQKQAFGVWWSGFPLGYDITDNKTLILFVIWSIAAWNIFLKNDAKKIILISAFITIISYLIPHSLLGTEYNYSLDKLK